MNITEIKDILIEKFEDSIEIVDDRYFKVKPDIWLEVVTYIKEDENFLCDYLI